ncbi:hypothetical protein ACWGQ5_53785, partial [Streptomyces sp. NPDC055722]
MSSGITYTAVLDVRRATAEHLAKLLRGHRERLGTRKGTRALGVFRQAVLVLRWFVDGTRLVQLARGNGISAPTAYRYLHEGLTVLADHAPDLWLSCRMCGSFRGGLASGEGGAVGGEGEHDEGD